MKVLIVDDEKLIRDVIKEYCLGNKYEILEADNGIDAIKKAAEADIIVMDIMMPKMDGFTAYKEIKKKYNTPTIILSARGEEYDKLVGFDLGIDDYMTKPFSPKELIARINAVCKRYKKDENFFEYKGLKVDYLGHCVFIDGNEINLTPKEYDLLVYFIKNKVYLVQLR